MSGRLTRWIATGAVFVAAVVGCGTHDDTSTSITVFASSSLIAAFTDIGKRFKDENPGASVEFIFASSSDLAWQLTEGTGADVFAAGDSANMATVAEAGLLAERPVSFATNSLAIAVAPGNPKNIATFDDLNRPGLRVAVCGGPGTCASNTQRIEDSTRIRLRFASEESSPAEVLTKVTSGQADAGLVYTTDAINAGDNISWVRFPEADDAANTLSIARLQDSEHPYLAARFIDLVTGSLGKKILNQAGFAEPHQPVPQPYSFSGH
jgi:molybdate transport system substrate-binding protein